MFICFSCHESDKKVTKCNLNVYDHPRSYYGICEICGRWAQVAHCISYNNPRRKEQQCLFANRAMKKT